MSKALTILTAISVAVLLGVLAYYYKDTILGFINQPNRLTPLPQITSESYASSEEAFAPDVFYAADDEDIPSEDDLIPLEQAHLPVVEGLSRDENGILVGSLTLDTPRMLIGAFDVINVRAEPDTNAPIVTTIGLGQVVVAGRVLDGWYDVNVLPGMFSGFIRSDLLLDYSETTQYFAETLDWRGPYGRVSLVDVRTIIPDIEYYIIFATPDNFTGQTLYVRDVPMLQAATAEKLKAAQATFKADGFRIKLYDAYRPISVSGILYDIIQDTRYIAPAGSSTHNRAAAVDITLVDANGNELEMPSKMHTFDATAHRDSTAMSAKARENMDYMTNVMRQSGFTTLNYEWWHFNDEDRQSYMAMDIPIRDFMFYAVDAP